MEENLALMAKRLAGTGVSLRAHAKTHKSPWLARKQMALGAVGVCCQKVSEAEVMVEGGVENVLVSSEVTAVSKLRRLAALARHARLMVVVDHPQGVAMLSEADDGGRSGNRRAHRRGRGPGALRRGAGGCGGGTGPARGSGEGDSNSRVFRPTRAEPSMWMDLQ